MRPQNKKKETKPSQLARAKARQAKLTPLQKLEQKQKRLVNRCEQLEKTNREKTAYIYQQRETIETLKQMNADKYVKLMNYQIDLQKIKAENAKTIASIEKNAILKIRLLKAGLILSLAVNIICIIILLYLINY